MYEAARVDDPIAHSQALGGLIAGALIGGLAAVAVIATAPFSVPVLIAGAAIAGATVGGAAVGELVGSLSFAQTIEGKIAPPCSPDVSINGRKAARAHVDFVDCARHPAHPVIAQGSASVFINGQHAARKGDRTACDAKIHDASPDVFFGGETVITDDISPEVPAYVHTAMLAVGLASAVILFGPAAAALGFVGSVVGGEVMGDLGGKLFGEGSDGQKLMAFGGSLAGGLAGGKGGARFDRNYTVRQTGLGMNGGGLSVTRNTPGAPRGGGANVASNSALHARHVEVLRTTEQANPLVESLRTTGRLPANYATKADAIAAGWKPGKALDNSLPGGQIGGDVFQNSTGVLPNAPGRTWYEADVGLNGAASRAKQPGTRLLYSNDGELYVTPDHYGTVHPIGRWK